MGAGNGAASNGTQAYVNGEGDGKVVVVSLNTTKISFFLRVAHRQIAYFFFGAMVEER